MLHRRLAENKLKLRPSKRKDQGPQPWSTGSGARSVLWPSSGSLVSREGYKKGLQAKDRIQNSLFSYHLHQWATQRLFSRVFWPRESSKVATAKTTEWLHPSSRHR